MRDVIAHFYFGINYKRTWLVVTNDIPVLKPLIIKVLDDMRCTG
ncbi:MAG: DUF86 domain-containing protein [Nitrospirae bacterium]|nr:DUF86 domain-containing protein [Nitrospirota bacterium]